ncbi:unnamed protein product [Rotaria sp. Silwood1]|nr:unnamed protein product [Rotaria sp. Silwood1]CAF4849282.1 unnamed protein product [Rotaria sp. Silwood1]
MKRNKLTDDIKQYAVRKIIKKLLEFRQERTEDKVTAEELDNENESDWTEIEPKSIKVAKGIWNMWYNEREKCPRAGIIFLCRAKLNKIKVLLTKYIKNNRTQYGFPKGKIEFGETILQCAAREASEELGLAYKYIYNMIKYSTPIKKKVFNIVDKSFVEHYYFIVPVEPKDMKFKIDKKEIDDVEWRSIGNLPCRKSCSVMHLIKSANTLTETNYFMVICRDLYKHTSLVKYMEYSMASCRKKYSISSFCKNDIKRYLRVWLHPKGSQRPNSSLMDKCVEDAYKKMLQKLFEIERHFYIQFNAQKLPRKPNGKDWKQFAIPEIRKMLNTVYHKWISHLSPDNESINDNYSKCSANLIWKDWCYERFRGPRVGVMLISTMKENAEEALVISYIIDQSFKCLNIGFPKGKPDSGETIKEGGVREFLEETGMIDPHDILKMAICNGTVITKYPYIGTIQQCRSRTHHYVLATTTRQDMLFRGNKKEVCDVYWHSIYTLPCCDACKIKWKYTLYNDLEIPVSYHMVTLRDMNGENSAVL